MKRREMLRQEVVFYVYYRNPLDSSLRLLIKKWPYGWILLLDWSWERSQPCRAR